MRTQEEILTMIHKIQRSDTDPTRVQRKVLVHKLEWAQALQFIAPDARTEKAKEKFERLNSLDSHNLNSELQEHVDQLFMFLADGDVVKIHIHLQLIMTYLWLLRKDELCQWIYRRLGWANCNFRKVGRFVAEEIGMDWKILEMRYV